MTPAATLPKAAATLRVLLLPALLALAGCAAIPDIDRELLAGQHAPVQMKGADQSRLPRAGVASVLQNLKSRSPETSIFDRHLAVEEALAGTPLSVGNRVTLLEDGNATYPAMLAAIKSARHHVHMEMYIFEGDVVGREFQQALIERARAGVKVRLVIDGVGSIGTPKEFFGEIAAAGAEVYEFNPVGRVHAINNRNHRKVLIVDGRTAFVGGINISGVYTPEGVQRTRGGIVGGSSGDDEPFEKRPWRDMQVRIEGPGVADVQRGFFKIWSQMDKAPPPTDAAYFPKTSPVGPHVMRVVDGWTPEGTNPLYATLVSAIESAETRVRITNAYFVPHDDLLDALKRAAQRGVDVRLILPSRTDHWMVFHAGRSYYEQLLAAGVKIHERESRMLHSKTASVDGVWATVGSTNLDWRSLVHNEEVNVVVLGPEFAAQLDRAFERDATESTLVTAEGWAGRPMKDRVRERAAVMWARLL
jgi:cardiolipin synthase